MQPCGKVYTFNRCFNEMVSNANVYTTSCKDIVLSSLNGINGTIFSYGQTGAGKTYTMLGDYSSEIIS
jgi:centromeric protein E